MNTLQTSWGEHAAWYDEYLRDNPDTYQTKVMLPNLLRLVDARAGMTVLDLACGQGFFSEALKRAGAKVIGVDIARELITLAKKNCSPEISFHITSAHRLGFIKDRTIDCVVLVLALQNIEKVSDVMAEVARVLKSKGRAVIVMNHPAFRVPQGSEWGWDEEKKTQYRRVDRYLSEFSTKIQMHPGDDPSAETISFHRPLQWYVKAFSKNGLAVTRFEEWISHRMSQKGPRQIAEDKARKEMPLFLGMELRRLGS